MVLQPSVLGSSKPDGCEQRDIACAEYTGRRVGALMGVGVILSHHQIYSSCQGSCSRAALVEDTGPSVFPPPPSQWVFGYTTSKSVPLGSAL